MPQISPANLYINSYQPTRRSDNSANTRVEENLRIAQDTGNAVNTDSNNRDVRLIPAVNRGQGLNSFDTEQLAEESRLSRPVNQQSPAAEYQLNQDILRREEIDQLVGIDLYV